MSYKILPVSILFLFIFSSCSKPKEPEKDICDGVASELHVIKIPKGAGYKRTPGTIWYDPPIKEIKVCDDVLWENLDQMHHTATSSNGVSPSFGTPFITPGAKSQPKHFRVAGEYLYHCAPHPWMKGKLIVKPR